VHACARVCERTSERGYSKKHNEINASVRHDEERWAGGVGASGACMQASSTVRIVRAVGYTIIYYMGCKL
jgi:hypothetical protein